MDVIKIFQPFHVILFTLEIFFTAFVQPAVLHLDFEASVPRLTLVKHAPETLIRISEISTNDSNNLSKIPLTVHGGRTEMSAPSSKSHSKYFSSHPCLEASLRGVSPTRASFVSITFLSFLVMSFWYRNQSNALLLWSRSSSHRVDFLPKLTPAKITNCIIHHTNQMCYLQRGNAGWSPACLPPSLCSRSPSEASELLDFPFSLHVELVLDLPLTPHWDQP